MLTLIFAAGLVLAPAAAGQPESPATAPAPAAARADAAAPSITDLSMRRGRLAAFIRVGWHQGWLDREGMEDAFAKLRANRREQGDMEAATDGPLSEAQRNLLSRGLDELSESLRHTRAKKNAEPRQRR